MSKIFISYRREDSAATCGRIYDRLVARFGRDAVFKDVDMIPFGVRFREYIAGIMAQCAVELVVIGPAWLDIPAADGQRRLDHPDDLVRQEIEAGLERQTVLIPVLVQGASFPPTDRLPESLRSLVDYNGVPVRYDPDFDTDMRRLTDQIERRLAAPAPAAPLPTPPSPRPEAQPAADPDARAELLTTMPPDRFPPRFAALGFVPRISGGVEYILPPVCDVPAGAFLMGSDPTRDHDAHDDEQPQHRATLSAYHIARFPVTVAEYACFVRAGHARPKKAAFGVDWPTQLTRLDHPVTCVTWKDAMAYAAWLAERTGQPWRLPSEAEWEKTARGTDGRIYPWGDTFDKTRCNTNASGIQTTTPVDRYPTGASPYGALDLAGNAREWTASIKAAYPYTPADGRDAPESMGAHALRGGSWYFIPQLARAAYRDVYVPIYLSEGVGIRLLRAVPGS